MSPDDLLGKTHTMLGYDLWAMAASASAVPVIATDDSTVGIIPRASKWMFGQLCDDNFASVEVSYIELYNDSKVFDLLRSADAEAECLEIREAKGGDIRIPGLTRVSVKSSKEILDLLWTGAKIRRIAATDMNDYSSRSHTVFVVYFQRKDSTGQVISSSKFSFVDLAGSEKWKSSQLAMLSAERVKELTTINRSLSALGNCVSALMQKNRSHIPYRDSKLTRLLQDSLGGNTLALFVVTLSAAVQNIEETASTLQFADRAMKVQVLVTKSTQLSPAQSVEGLKTEIRNLKALLQSTLQKIGNDGAPAMSNVKTLGDSINVQIQELQEENMSLLQSLKTAQEELQKSLEENRTLMTIIEQMKASSKPSFDIEVEADAAHKELAEAGSGLAGFSESLQFSILAARSNEVEQRLQAAANIEAIQEERWALLMDYHNWLQAQGQSCSVDHGDSGIPASDIFRRVQLMEGSILIQADELRRAKKIFLKVAL